MEIKLFLIVFIIASLYISCSETECCGPPEEITMVGHWKLEKLCFSTGASSCSEEDMWNADTDEVLTFREDGTFTFDIEGEICEGNYEIVALEAETISNVNLNSTVGNCNFTETIFWLGRLTYDEMIFSPRCIEGCPHLYKRIQN